MSSSFHRLSQQPFIGGVPTSLSNRAKREQRAPHIDLDRLEKKKSTNDQSHSLSLHPLIFTFSILFPRRPSEFLSFSPTAMSSRLSPLSLYRSLFLSLFLSFSLEKRRDRRIILSPSLWPYRPPRWFFEGPARRMRGPARTIILCVAK